MIPAPPELDLRNQDALLRDLLRRIPDYAPEWSAGPSGPGRAVLQAFARYMGALRNGLNRLPGRSMLSFLDTLGAHLLPAQAARAPLVFTLQDNGPVDPTLPANSQVAAKVPPPVPSPGNPNPPAPDPVVFATTHAVTLTRARLAALHSVMPGSDQYADHSASLTTGFTLFDGLDPIEHSIYLGHDSLFALAGDITVLLFITLSAGASRSLPAEWEYLSVSGWLPLQALPQDDTTSGLRKDGQVSLRRECGPAAKKETIFGRTSYWVRGRLTAPLLPESTAGERTVPIIDNIQTRVSLRKSGILPEAAFTDSIPLDTSKDFYPFGPQPSRHTTFYVACKEVFARKAARATLTFSLSIQGVPAAPKDGKFLLVWEYYNGMDWAGLGVEPGANSDSAYNFPAAGSVSFLCPRDWDATKVNGTENYWLRVRIVDGDYGSPVRLVVITDKSGTRVEATGGDLTPPKVKKLTLSYWYLTDPEPLHYCLSLNNFVFEDHTDDCLWPGLTFQPFRPETELSPAVYFGFDRRFATGLISMYASVTPSSSASGQSSPFIWEYRARQGWTELGVLDETVGFRSSGMIQWIGPPDAIAEAGPGGELFRIRARIKDGGEPVAATLAGMWLNAVWASHQYFLAQQDMGESDGNPGQTFPFRSSPVLAGEKIEVQEWTGKGDYWRSGLADVPESDLRMERDPSTGAVTAVWVRWRERPYLSASAPTDRHYELERATGFLRFGDGVHGTIPAAGKRISASYTTGGGVIGNVPAGAIGELRTSVPSILSVSNVAAAAGGADPEVETAVFQRGPQALRTRGRAVSAQDFEWLAHEASPEIARAVCLPITGYDGHAQRGWITLIVVPYDSAAQPQPTSELRRLVNDHLVQRAPFTLTRRIRVIGPSYTPVRVRAEIVPLQAQSAATVESLVRQRLDQFLHPVLGGLDGAGWAFGATIYLSQAASVIETTPGVDYARRVTLMCGDQVFDEALPVDSGYLPTAGAHELRFTGGA